MILNIRNLTLAVSVLLTGCASTWNVGESEFDCTGDPVDPSCMSTRQIYNATNDGKVPIKGFNYKDNKMVKSQEENNEPIPGTYESVNETIVKNYVAPNLPDRPVPVRTPAKVMRIWVAPWEDQSGDLNTVGYIYTEIEPRKWVLGSKAYDSNVVLRPLQTQNYDEKKPENLNLN